MGSILEAERPWGIRSLADLPSKVDIGTGVLKLVGIPLVPRQLVDKVNLYQSL